VTSSASRAKRDRERLREEKAARKRARRVELTTVSDDPAAEGRPRRAESDVLTELAAVHRRFEDGAIGFDEFEATRNELMGELDVG